MIHIQDLTYSLAVCIIMKLLAYSIQDSICDIARDCSKQDKSEHQQYNYKLHHYLCMEQWPWC